MSTTDYPGIELDLFAAATVWKSYYRKRITPYFGEEVLEVGAGIGGTTAALCQRPYRRWVCLEPSSVLFTRLRDRIARGELSAGCVAKQGTTADLDASDRFDSILYIDVLEHIEDDAAELHTALTHLNPGGTLIVLSPANPSMYSEFDKELGHFRRYTRASLLAAAPRDLPVTWAGYLDSVGALTSLANKMFLRQSTPTARQIALWDKVFVRMSLVLDPILRYRVGRSVVAIWRKSDERIG